MMMVVEHYPIIHNVYTISHTEGEIISIVIDEDEAVVLSVEE